MKLQQLCFAKLLVLLSLDAQNGAEFLVSLGEDI